MGQESGPTYDIDPRLKHCQAEIDEALRAKDVAKVRAIVEREGLEWLDPMRGKVTRSAGVAESHVKVD